MSIFSLLLWGKVLFGIFAAALVAASKPALSFRLGVLADKSYCFIVSSLVKKKSGPGSENNINYYYNAGMVQNDGGK